MTREEQQEQSSESIFESPVESDESKEGGRCLLCRIWWKVAVVLLLVAAVIGIVAGKQGESGKQEVAPGQIGGKVENSGDNAEDGPEQKTFPPEAVLATVNGEEITLAELEDALEQLPQQHQSAFKNNRHGLLDQLVSEKLLLQKARTEDITETEEYQDGMEAHESHPGHEKHVLIDALLQREVLGDIEITDEEVRAFYEKHKAELSGDRDFEDIKDSLRSYVRQEKQNTAIQTYLSRLREDATINRNEEWIEAQKALAANNPLDRALAKDVPVLADFGRDSCIPCKKMKPILDDLKDQYKGRAEILIIQTDQYPAITQRVGVRAIPTQIFYDAEGNEVDRHQGFMGREAITEQLKEMGVE
ncbi:MAG: thioredoxin domain-containing protein [Candidatus Brocadiia bacterium]